MAAGGPGANSSPTMDGVRGGGRGHYYTIKLCCESWKNFLEQFLAPLALAMVSSPLLQHLQCQMPRSMSTLGST